jgi:hypothetical protein
MFALSRGVAMKGSTSGGLTPRRNTWNSFKSGMKFKIELFRDVIPFTALVVGICALSFQVTVLHPFHDDLTDEFVKVMVSSIIIG